MRQYKDEVICDLAETYSLYDYKSVPVSTLAVLVCGLRPDSRLALALSESRYDTDTILLARIADELAFLSWTKTKDAEKNRNRPKSIVEFMTNKIKENDVRGFNSIKEFEEARASFFNGV